MRQKKGELKAEIDRLWLDVTREQINKMVAAKEFSKALEKIDEYKGGLTKDAQALKDHVTDQADKENQQFRASVSAASIKGDYLGAIDWLLKFHDPKPQDWGPAMKSVMNNAANTLLARTAKVQGFQPNADLKTLRDDLNRFAVKINQVDEDFLPPSVKTFRSERTRIEGTFETVNLLQSVPPKLTIADWARSAAEVQRTYPDRQIKTKLADSLGGVLKLGLSVNKPSVSFASAGKALVDDMGTKSKWTDFQKALAKETDPKYNIAKKVVSDVLATETWPNVEAVLKAN
jgi:hypothetical protein